HVLGQIGAAEDIALDAIRHSNLAIGAACLGGMKRCSQLIFQHATQRQIGEAGLVAHPVTMTRLGRIAAEVTALECLVRLLADGVDAGRSINSEPFTVCKLVGADMLWQAVDDLVQLLGRRGLVETPQVRQLVDDARVLRGLDGPAEAGAAILGAGLLENEFEPLRSLDEEMGGLGDDPLLEQASRALREGSRQAANLSPAAKHWVAARVGELTSWIVLLAAVEGKRRMASNVDLERTSRWTRSNLESAISLLRSGPPAEVRLGTGVVNEVSASYGQTDNAITVASAPGPALQVRLGSPSADLQRWAISWLAERLRVDESRIDPRRSFADHGVDSLAAVEFANALAARAGVALDETLLWNFPTIESLLDYLDTDVSSSAQPAASDQQRWGAAPAEPTSGESDLEAEMARLELELKKRPR
ncbi:MAG: hypothetical protein RL033_4377, partial [Pseudomonadota bacterium]